jgi:ectoine hydroxylase-related dioxygenase (phytanoyl-CoA dioxygenase family)
MPEAFHGPEDYRSQMKAAAAAAGVEAPEPTFIEVPAGSCVFHAGEIWHGSGHNRTGDRMRRSIGIHMVPCGARFSDRPGGYIYRRYQRTDDPTLDESFFPLLWTEEGGRTAWIDGYCRSGRRRNEA